MKQYDFIGIKSFKIDGIINPNVTIAGTIKYKDGYELVLKADNKKIEFNHIPTNREENFIINAVLPKDTKQISLYYKKSKQDKFCLVATRKTNMFKRFVKKILGFFVKLVKKAIRVLYVLKRGIKYLWREYHFLVPISLWPKYIKDFRDSVRRYNHKFFNPMLKSDYLKWLRKEKDNTEELKALKYQPLISILVPVYNVEPRLLKECVDSVLNQTYDNFELCLVDDASTNKDTKKALAEYQQLDKRIRVKYRNKNGHISEATNDALKMAKGEFISLLDNDDVLDKNALYWVVDALNNNDKLDFIYSDEDKLDLDGHRCEPNFKPDFSPDTLLSMNYICHFTTIRKALVDKVGGFEKGLEGAQDYDLFLKTTELTDNIYHIPKILYHWRKVEGSTALKGSAKLYAEDKGKKALENALARRKIPGTVEIDDISKYYKINYDVKGEPLISIVIPTRDYADILKKCVDSIYEKTTYRNFEIIVADNDSKEKETLKYFKETQKKHDNFHVVECKFEFNYSKINNIAVKHAKGEYIVLLNNDTEVITPEWLDIMVGYASQKHVGIVGPKLLYPDGTVQHAGVILGLGGVASHAYIGANRNDTGLYGRLRVPYNYSACTAACFMIKKDIYTKLKGLNEELKVAYNDIDFCIRVLKEGYYNVFVPQVELLHYESKSRGFDTTTEKYKRFLIESNYMYEKWENTINNDRFYNPNFSKNGWFVLDSGVSDKND